MVRYIYPEERPRFYSSYYARAEMTRRLILINAGVFLLQMMTGPGLLYLFGLTPHLVMSRFMIWQLGTYMFLHGGFFHVFFNMFILWIFGNDLEQAWGPRKFLTYYLFTGLGAGLISLIFYWNSPVPIVGASGAIFGILLAYGLRFPMRQILVFFIFPMQARYFVFLLGLIELMNIMSASQSGIANFAHLGGMFFGYLFLRYEQDATQWLASRPLARPQPRHTTRTTSYSYETPFSPPPRAPAHTSHLQEQVDAVLDKISQEGLSSLTPDELDILKRAKNTDL